MGSRRVRGVRGQLGQDRYRTNRVVHSGILQRVPVIILRGFQESNLETRTNFQPMPSSKSIKIILSEYQLTRIFCIPFSPKSNPRKTKSMK